MRNVCLSKYTVMYGILDVLLVQIQSPFDPKISITTTW